MQGRKYPYLLPNVRQIQCKSGEIAGDTTVRISNKGLEVKSDAHYRSSVAVRSPGFPIASIAAIASGAPESSTESDCARDTI